MEALMHTATDLSPPQVACVATRHGRALSTAQDWQLRRWEAQEITEAQRRAMGRISGRLEWLRPVITAILTLADELKQGTTERVPSNSDLEEGWYY
jgi:hypothetical protein